MGLRRPVLRRGVEMIGELEAARQLKSDVAKSTHGLPAIGHSVVHDILKECKQRVTVLSVAVFADGEHVITGSDEHPETTCAGNHDPADVVLVW